MLINTPWQRTSFFTPRFAKRQLSFLVA